MRVVHISPVDIVGGASRGAYSLHKALRDADVDSLMFVLRKYSDDPTVLTHASRYNILYQGLRDRLDRLPLRFYDWKRSDWWTVGWLPFGLRRVIDGLRPDVVHFHWAGRGAAPIATLGQLKDYPLVWTLRDMWPLTGGCHYSGDCERLLSGCGRCPQLGSTSRLDISSWQWRRKYRAWRDVTANFVAPSTWMGNWARRSPLLHGNDVSVIPNGVDISRFKPIDRTAARAAWNLPQDRKIILFGAINSTGDPRKGFAYLAEALRILASQGWDRRATAVVFGTSAERKVDLGFPAIYAGTLQDDISLALLYSSADVMVAPSTQENAGKTGIEAMACGTPVVAFANTGQIDIVDHKINGYLAENLSAEDLARGIAWCLARDPSDNRLSREARGKVVRRFDIRSIAAQYVALYERRIAQRRPAPEEHDAGATVKSRIVSTGAKGAALSSKMESLS